MTPAADLDTVMTAMHERVKTLDMPSLETAAFMKGFVSGWVNAEKHHGMGAPLVVAQLLRQMKEGQHK